MTDVHQRNTTQYDSVPYKNQFIPLGERVGGGWIPSEFAICDAIIYMAMPNLRERIRKLIKEGADDAAIIALVEDGLVQH